ncbi:SDR family oxidoreductase [Nocardia sp. NPDC088792]|uniref:SDR family oxidoreductase n=1 Tax=Nocardia sp. NPDC088792 TaxID=3364332 RepID=UPI00382CB2B4
MRVFVTGATGFVGSVVVRELLDAGHEVLGLARSDASAAALAATGAQVQRGDLTDLDSLRGGAAATDGVIHTAYIHDFSQFQAAARTDRRAVAAMADALAGSDRPLVVTSGSPLRLSGETATEDSVPDPGPFGIERYVTEELAMTFADRGVRVSVLRLPPSVHGVGDHAFVPMLIAAARERGRAAYIGDGANRWPAVHRVDAARLFRLALESAPAGTRWHAVAEEGVPFREIATAIGHGLGVPVVSVAPEDAAEQLGFLGAFAGLDFPASSELTRKEFGWEPAQPTLLADLAAGHYFQE